MHDFLVTYAITVSCCILKQLMLLLYFIAAKQKHKRKQSSDPESEFDGMSPVSLLSKIHMHKLIEIIII